jgi:RNA exonuclease 1
VQVLIDSLIAPGLPITDTRAHIHGITEQQLATATWTLRHAQAALLKICSDRTVLVGHSLHKDLRALKFNHR